MTNTELNEAVARKLGSTVKCGCDCLAPTDQPDNEWTHPLHYSTDMRAAWEIVEKFDKLSMGRNKARNNNWSCFLFVSANECYEGHADTASLAIVLAFLKLSTVKK